MSLSHRFHPEAFDEYEEAARYYASQQPGLELRFITCVEDAIVAVCEDPERWRFFAGREIRRAFVHVFPYSILYAVESEQVIIVAIAHHRRKPGYWQQRL